MRNNTKISVIIPAINEEKSIGKVISEIPEWVDEIIAVDNGSTDRTASEAKLHGAKVLFEPRKGYGSACLTGTAALQNPDIVLFLDGDYSDYPDESAALVDPIINDEAEMVIGSRILGHAKVGALTPQAKFGNWLACELIGWFWGIHYTDLGPFRAIKFSALQSLGMQDPDYGWTVEMQIKAAQKRIRSIEVPVRYRKRIGKSKVSGTLRGVWGAGIKILGIIFLSVFREKWNRRRNFTFNVKKQKYP
jgi:glycosyltransferase involved in cell wall biosynthesis